MMMFSIKILMRHVHGIPPLTKTWGDGISLMETSVGRKTRSGKHYLVFENGVRMLGALAPLLHEGVVLFVEILGLLVLVSDVVTGTVDVPEERFVGILIEAFHDYRRVE